MIRKIIGGTVAVVIGGSTFAISQGDVVNNFAKNSGMSQDQAQQYVNNIASKDLQSFGKIGESFISDGNGILSASNGIDCNNYKYTWESPTLSCDDGKNQLTKTGNDEVSLGNCLKSLDTNLGPNAKPKINECIQSIDVMNSDYSFQIVSATLSSKDIDDAKNSNIYNKSVLEAAIKN